jgi:ferredoxin-NADP reductase
MRRRVPPLPDLSRMSVAEVDVPLVVTARRDETPDHVSVVFARPPRFDFAAGDWIDLAFKQELSGGRTYSLSSSPTEPDLVITFKVGQSGIKKTLQTATPGDTYRITAFGNDYDFSLRRHRRSVLIAAGVGVAPFRSMVKEMYDASSTDTAHLVYLNRTPDFLFREELDHWCSQLPGVTISYVVTADMKSKERRRLLAATVGDAVHLYYVAGPPAMIEATETILMDAGVDHDDIRIDAFGGY